MNDLQPASEGDFHRQAREFAEKLSATTKSVLGPDTEPFVARGISYERTAKVVVRQESQSGLVLNVAGNPMLRLKSSFSCTWDHRQAYLAVEESAFTVLLITDQEPLFRFEYLRSPTGSVPVAHLQVHAHRDAFTFAMMMCGVGSTRGRRRGRAVQRGQHRAKLAELHFPLGGHRFRPCLEDVLAMLLDEFGVDSIDGAHAAIAHGRAEWRRKQLGAAIRDSAETAATVLRELGYSVAPPAEGHYPDRNDRLRAY